MEKPKILNTKPSEEFDYQAALYFLPEQGHYMFRYKVNGAGFASKFVRHNDVAAAFHGVEVDSGWIDPNIKRIGADRNGEWFVFFMPPGVMKIPFKFEDTVEILEVPVPATVLMGSGDVYSIFAIKGEEFLPNAKLCEMPLPNMYTGGRVCWGDTPLPKASHASARQVWELFFSSVFTAHESGNRVKGIKESCLPFWKDLAKRKVRTFPKRRLIELNKTVAGMFTVKRNEEG